MCLSEGFCQVIFSFWGRSAATKICFYPLNKIKTPANSEILRFYLTKDLHDCNKCVCAVRHEMLQNIIACAILESRLGKVEKNKLSL